MTKVHEIKHPLVQHKLTIMRKKETSTSKFRSLLKEISLLLAYEVTRHFEVHNIDIETPLAPMKAPKLNAQEIVIVSILRAGQGILDGMIQLIPSARIGFIGLARDPKTLEAHEYYFKVPNNLADSEVLIVDPMLATGHSAIAAVQRIKELNPKGLRFVCLLAAPEGIRNFHNKHPEVEIYTAAIDEKLNEKGYIIPGLGDAGDRLFGT